MCCDAPVVETATAAEQWLTGARAVAAHTDDAALADRLRVLACELQCLKVPALICGLCLAAGTGDPMGRM
jgi:hypothetical protein